MDRAEAIGVLTIEQASHRKDGLVDRAIDMAIAALREREQREQECEFCGGRHIITSVTVRHSMVGYDDVLGKVKVNFTETLKPPKHCPECGRKLSEAPKEGADHE